MRERKAVIYFPGLNALRFIAALAVLVFHVEHRKNLFGQANLWERWRFLEPIGELGVTLFFVISGFLITYLLLAERGQNGTISIKDFYVRRILRIWPLYYLIVLLSFFVLPHLEIFDVPHSSTQPVAVNFGWKLLLFMFFLPNAAFVGLGHVPFAKQAWSVGVEEQFYLTWPWMVRWMARFRHLVVALLLVLGVSMGSRFLVSSIRPFFEEQRLAFALLGMLERFLHLLRFGCMAIGALGACVLYHERTRLLRVIYSAWTQVLVAGALIALCAAGIKDGIVDDEAYSMLFIVIILNLCSNPRSILKLENRVFDFLGKISYGIYMYHEIFIILGIKLLLGAGDDIAGMVDNVILYLLALGGTIGTSYLSYAYFEKYFLRLKMKFTSMLSGNEGRELSPAGS